jgi:hypothetical protein
MAFLEDVDKTIEPNNYKEAKEQLIWNIAIRWNQNPWKEWKLDTCTLVQR